MGESGDFGKSPFFGQLSVKVICLTARQRTTPRAVTPGEFAGIFCSARGGSWPTAESTAAGRGGGFLG
jgi:hypothetical protein